MKNQTKIVQSEINRLYEESAEGTKIRAKVRYLETDEKPTRFFLASAKYISKLTKTDGTATTGNSEIMEECTIFYQKIYKRESIDSTLDSYFFQEMPVLNDDAVEHCEGDITLKECDIALKIWQITNLQV